MRNDLAKGAAGRITLLHVEDDPEHFQIASIQLQRLSDRVDLMHAETVAQAREALAGEPVDCILCDYQLPDESGLKFLAELRDRGNETPFIFFTGQGSEEIAAEALRAGADDYFTKEGGLAHFQRLLNSINRVVEADKQKRERRLAEAHIDQLFTNAPEAMVLLDRDDRVLRINDEFTTIFGYGSEELVGKSLTNLLVPPHLLDESAVMTGKVAAGQPVVTESQRKHKDGRLIDVSVLVTPVFFGGEQVALYAIYRDISERIQAQKALRESEEQYRLLAETARDLIVSMDLGGGIRYANPAAIEIGGYAPEGLIGKSIFDYLLPEYRAEYVDRLARRAAGDDEKYISEVEIFDRDGSKVPLEISASLIRRDGVPVGTLVVCRDITKRKQMICELQESRDRLSILAEATFEGLVIHASGIIQDCNENLLAMSGFQRGEILGRDVLDFIAPDYRDIVAERIHQSFEGYYEIEVVGENGVPFPVEVCAKTIPSRHGNLRAVAVRDLRQWKKAEDQIRQNERRFKEFVESVPAVVFEADHEGWITYTNQAGLQMFGYAAADLERGLHLSQFHRPQDLQAAEALFREVVATGSVKRNVEFHLVRADGSEFPAMANIAPIVREECAGGIRGMLVDISQSRELERRLRESESRFRELVSNLPHPVFELNAKGLFVWLNAAGRRFFGLSDEEIERGFSFIDLLSPDGMAKAHGALAGLISGSEDRIQLELDVRSAGGKRSTIAVQVTPLSMDDRRVGACVIVVDLPEP